MISAYDPIDQLEAFKDDPFIGNLRNKKKALEEAGIKYIGQLFFVDKVSGIDDEKYKRALIRLRNYLTNTIGSGIDAYTMLKRSEELVRTIHTGSMAVDYILGGGIRTGIITEFAGPYRSGKTQISLTASIAVQLPPEVQCPFVVDCESKKDQPPFVLKDNPDIRFNDFEELDKIGRGLGKKAIYIDTEGSFEPLRLKPIAERFGLDPNEALKNIIVYRVTTVDEQFEAAREAGFKIPEENIGLVIVDSLMNLFRAEFVGRDQLSARQQMVNKFVHMLNRMADIYNIAVVITNQVMETPDMYARTDEYGLKVVGGHVVAHNVGIRAMLNIHKSGELERKGSYTIRRIKIVDSSFLPQREVRFGIDEKGVIDVEIKTLCSFVISDYVTYGKPRGLERLFAEPSANKLRGAKRKPRGVVTIEKAKKEAKKKKQ